MCKCTNSYCLKCLCPEVHSCNYDYLGEHQKELRKINLLVAAEKISKI